MYLALLRLQRRCKRWLILYKNFLVKLQKQTVKDPVCGVEMDPKNAKATLEKDGQTYYFCSASCKDKFAQGKLKKDNSGGGCCCS
ncbi:MAG: YHS domain-containing protein [bacterium]|nr:YHS domain-containing protein [bacterium]